MQITFNTPYGFSPDSTPGETTHASGVLREVVRRLNSLVKSYGSGASVSITRTGRCLFTFNLPSLFSDVSTPVEDGAALQVLLEGLIALNRGYLAHHHVPRLYSAGVIYGRTEIWDTIPALYAKKYDGPNPALYSKAYGDCKSLSAALIAERESAGLEAQQSFRWVRTESGVKDYHILVLTPNGWEDPSKVLGMGRNENALM